MLEVLTVCSESAVICVIYACYSWLLESSLTKNTDLENIITSRGNKN